MAKRHQSLAISKMPHEDCPACHGFGSIRVTAHFHVGDYEFEAPCWQCFGQDVKVKLPTTDNR